MNYKKKYINLPELLPSLLVGILLVFSCQSEVSSKDEATKSSSSLSVESITPNQKWATVINSQIDSLESLYTEKAVKIKADGTVINGRKEIVEDWRKAGLAIDSFSLIQNIIANKKSTYEYEISAFWTKDKRQYKQLVIWNNNDGKKLKELEMVVEVSEIEPDITAIDSQRANWIRLCNLHNAQDLVTQVYTPNSIYYNHKPVVIGRELITKEYGYMNNEKYQLMLNPIIVEPVNENLVFEIGQCAGSYRGKYILVWQKMDNGDWQILMDSNI